MSHHKHNQATQENVARRIFQISAPLGDWDELPEVAREEWMKQASGVLDLAFQIPGQEELAFFEEFIPEPQHVVDDISADPDLLEPWENVLTGTRPKDLQNPVMDQVSEMRTRMMGKRVMGRIAGARHERVTQ